MSIPESLLTLHNVGYGRPVLAYLPLQLLKEYYLHRIYLQTEPMAQKQFLHTPSVRINNEFIIFNNNWRFETKKVNAVFVAKQATYKRYPICLGLFFLVLAAACSSITCGIIAAFCFLLACLMKAQYVLRLRMDIGEVRPIASPNKSELEDIKKAIEAAILYEETEEEE